MADPLGSCLWWYCDFVTFPFGILGQVWYLIVSIPDPCCLSYFDLLNIDYLYFEQIIFQIYPTKLQLNKVNFFDTEVPNLNLDLSKSNSIVWIKIYNDKQDDFNFWKSWFLISWWRFSLLPSSGVFIPRLIRFVRVCSNVSDINYRHQYFLLLRPNKRIPDPTLTYW